MYKRQVPLRSGGWRLYYTVFGVTTMRIAVAESADGLHWEKPVRLSQAALETLSIVAFKQPITKAEVEHIRGVVSDSVLRHLLEKGLVRIAGRSDGVGRPLLYGTARDFLRFFGLKTLAELPEIKEVEELLREDEAAQSAEAAAIMSAVARAVPEGASRLPT